MNEYILGYDEDELKRLALAAVLLHDPKLDHFASKSKTCLEIGCSSGVNLPLILKANPDIEYTGIDISEQAIASAAKKYRDHKNVKFIVMNAADLHFNQRFDLIFTKLVLWSVGNNLKSILQNIRRLLSGNGIFYALEPCNQFIEFYPPKPAASAWMKKWNEAARQHGHNPYLGTSIASELIRAGFKNVDTSFHAATALGWQHEKYLAIIDNFKGFFMGAAADKFGINQAYPQEKCQALAELALLTPDSFVMDALCAAWGW